MRGYNACRAQLWNSRTFFNCLINKFSLIMKLFETWVYELSSLWLRHSILSNTGLFRKKRNTVAKLYYMLLVLLKGRIYKWTSVFASAAFNFARASLIFFTVDLIFYFLCLCIWTVFSVFTLVIGSVWNTATSLQLILTQKQCGVDFHLQGRI